MADIKISQLPAVTTVDPLVDVLPLVSDSGVTTTKATPNQIVQAVLPAPGAIGSTTPNTAAFTTLSASSTVSGAGFSAYLSSPPAIGNVAPNSGTFTSVTATESISSSLSAGAFSYGSLGYSDTNLFSSYATSANSYVQAIFQNAYGGAAASVDVIVSNDIGTAGGSYGDFGMNSSGFTGTGSLALPNAVYMYAANGDLVLGTTTTNGIRFVVNNGATDALAISSAGALSGTAVSSYLSSPPPIGDVAPNTGAFTTLSASSTVSGTGFSNYLASPPAIGGTTPNTGSFTKVTTSAGTASVAPINMTAGTNLTAATAGAVEYDGVVAYVTPTAACRGVISSEQFVALTAAYTLTAVTTAQKLFNSTTNGQVTLPIGTFAFECAFNLSTLSATSGSFGFGLGGTATFTQYWTAIANKPLTSSATAAAPFTTFNTAANQTLVTANTNTTGYARITGVIRVTVAGTIIPQVYLGVASAAVVGLGSFFIIRPLGSSTVATVGNWS